MLSYVRFGVSIPIIFFTEHWLKALRALERTSKIDNGLVFPFERRLFHSPLLENPVIARPKMLLSAANRIVHKRNGSVSLFEGVDSFYLLEG